VKPEQKARDSIKKQTNKQTKSNLKAKKGRRAGGVGQVGECLPSKYEAQVQILLLSKRISV
jgi:hypothetical protein